MHKFIFVLGFIAIFASALADVECPKDEDEDSEAVYYPHEIECGKFYECDHGTAKILECPPGLYWDTLLNVCNTEVDCGSLLTSTAGPEPEPTTSSGDEDEE